MLVYLTLRIQKYSSDADIAQSVERRIGSAEVTGPIPVISLVISPVSMKLTGLFDVSGSVNRLTLLRSSQAGGLYSGCLPVYRDTGSHRL